MAKGRSTARGRIREQMRLSGRWLEVAVAATRDSIEELRAPQISAARSNAPSVSRFPAGGVFCAPQTARGSKAVVEGLIVADFLYIATPGGVSRRSTQRFLFPTTCAI